MNAKRGMRGENKEGRAPWACIAGWKRKKREMKSKQGSEWEEDGVGGDEWVGG